MDRAFWRCAKYDLGYEDEECPYPCDMGPVDPCSLCEFGERVEPSDGSALFV